MAQNWIKISTMPLKSQSIISLSQFQFCNKVVPQKSQNHTITKSQIFPVQTPP
jgi:hypothetical protein